MLRRLHSKSQLREIRGDGRHGIPSNFTDPILVNEKVHPIPCFELKAFEAFEALTALKLPSTHSRSSLMLGVRSFTSTISADTRPSTPSLAPWSWRHPWTLIPCKRLESRSILGPLALGNTNSRNCNLIFSTNQNVVAGFKFCISILKAIHKRLSRLSRQLSCVTPTGMNCHYSCLVELVVLTSWCEWSCIFSLGSQIGCIQGEHSFDGLELRYVTLGFDATLSCTPGQPFRPSGEHHPFQWEASSWQVYQIQWWFNKKRIFNDVILWLLQFSACGASSQNTPKSQWITHAQIIVKSMLHCLAPAVGLHCNPISSWCENKTPKLDVPCSIIRRIWRSISSCFTFRVSRGLQTGFGIFCCGTSAGKSTVFCYRAL